MIGAERARDIGLGAGPDDGNDCRAEMFGPLDGDGADATGRGVNHHGIALADAMDLAQQRLHRQSFQHHGGCLDVIEARRHFDEAIRGHETNLRIRPGTGPRVGDPVARHEVGDARTDGFDDTHALMSRNGRELRGVQPSTLVDVDEIEPDSGMTDPDLFRTGVACFDGFPTQNIGIAIGMESDRVSHSRKLRLRRQPSLGTRYFHRPEEIRCSDGS